jgi:8-oxo-dGTP pyrophosphatase MutT (NUDIX family)
MVSEGGGGDKSIVETCLREMEEEIGIGNTATTVLGVLRCNWGEVTNTTKLHYRFPSFFT